MIVNIDIETYCELNLLDVGVYKYVEHPSFEVLMIAWHTEDDLLGSSDEYIVDLASAKDLMQDGLYDPMTGALLEEIRDLVLDPDNIKTAFNANFERVCLSKHFDTMMPPSEWECTMVKAMTIGLPRS